jgi:hypothetical protein
MFLRETSTNVDRWPQDYAFQSGPRSVSTFVPTSNSIKQNKIKKVQIWTGGISQTTQIFFRMFTEYSTWHAWPGSQDRPDVAWVTRKTGMKIMYFRWCRQPVKYLTSNTNYAKSCQLWQPKRQATFRKHRMIRQRRRFSHHHQQLLMIELE